MFNLNLLQSFETDFCGSETLLLGGWQQVGYSFCCVYVNFEFIAQTFFFPSRPVHLVLQVHSSGQDDCEVELLLLLCTELLLDKMYTLSSHHRASTLTLIYPAHFEDVPCQSGVNHIFEG